MIEKSDLDQNCSKQGCDVEMKKDDIADHEMRCIFRTVPCPVTKCQKEILFKNIALHLRDKHTNVIPTNQPKIEPLLSKASLEAHRNNWILFTYYENQVQYYPIFVKRNDHWYFWVSIKDGHVAASTWMFTAKAENEDNRMSMEYSGLVHPIDLKVEEVIKTGQYLLLNRRSVEKLQVVEEAGQGQFKSLINITFKITKA